MNPDTIGHPVDRVAQTFERQDDSGAFNTPRRRASGVVVAPAGKTDATTMPHAYRPEYLS